MEKKKKSRELRNPRNLESPAIDYVNLGCCRLGLATTTFRRLLLGLLVGLDQVLALGQVRLGLPRVFLVRVALPLDQVQVLLRLAVYTIVHDGLDRVARTVVLFVLDGRLLLAAALTRLLGRLCDGAALWLLYWSAL